MQQRAQNRESRAEDARCIRTLPFILALIGRGDRTETIGVLVALRIAWYVEARSDEEMAYGS